MKNMAIQEMFRYCLALTLFLFCVALPEQGVWEETLEVNKDGKLLVLTKSMLNGSTVGVRIECMESQSTVTVSWLLRWTPCFEEYIGIETREKRYLYYLANPAYDQIDMGYQHVYFIRYNEKFECRNGFLQLQEWEGGWEVADLAVSTTPGQKTTGPQFDDATGAKGGFNRRGMDDTVPLPMSMTAVKRRRNTYGDQLPLIATTDRDGIFLFIIKIETTDEKEEPFFVQVSMKGQSGYLSAIEWPLLPFHGVMCMVYVVYGLAWLVLSKCRGKDLHRIQFWIGAVIFLGMLENAVFFAEYNSINKTGQSKRGAVVVAELVSSLKNAVTKMLLIIVSFGFGLVKPGLGVFGVGALYFILASLAGCLQQLKPKGDNSNQTLWVALSVAGIDIVIGLWIFAGLVRTPKMLRLKRSLKLSSFRCFTRTIGIAFLASFAYLIWAIKRHLARCLTDWKNLWVDEAFWHILSSVVLLVIMVLWRPTVDNQIHTFSPPLDTADKEAEQPLMSDADDRMKKRGGKPDAETDAEFTKKPKDAQNEAEDTSSVAMGRFALGTSSVV